VGGGGVGSLVGLEGAEESEISSGWRGWRQAGSFIRYLGKPKNVPHRASNSRREPAPLIRTRAVLSKKIKRNCCPYSGEAPIIPDSEKKRWRETNDDAHSLLALEDGRKSDAGVRRRRRAGGVIWLILQEQKKPAAAG